MSGSCFGEDLRLASASFYLLALMCESLAKVRINLPNCPEYGGGNTDSAGNWLETCLNKSERDWTMKNLIILLVVLAFGCELSAQTLKDRHAAKLRTDLGSPARKSTIPVPSARIRRAPGVSVPNRPPSMDKQLSAMENQTRKIIGTKPPRRTAATPAYVLPKPTPSTGGFDARPYLQKQKNMMTTNPSQQRGPTQPKAPGR
jgi:hypothetical protein